MGKGRIGSHAIRPDFRFGLGGNHVTCPLARCSAASINFLSPVNPLRLDLEGTST
jgi:hypothetical protein